VRNERDLSGGWCLKALTCDKYINRSMLIVLLLLLSKLGVRNRGTNGSTVEWKTRSLGSSRLSVVFRFGLDEERCDGEPTQEIVRKCRGEGRWRSDEEREADEKKILKISQLLPSPSEAEKQKRDRINVALEATC
jgi:hypothetical protein